ncbi:hypothetical protein [Limimaricola cinnabarinus]|jgi:hypothetical protein|uniref:hypothetical protein n=1 Tax=Limimaricola cinnabarinus TaxID=1125964 RepID=UPI002FE22350
MTALFDTPMRARLAGLAICLAVIAVFAGANAHLVAVSFASQPDCVLSPTMEGAAFRAAKPAC